MKSNNKINTIFTKMTYLCYLLIMAVLTATVIADQPLEDLAQRIIDSLKTDMSGGQIKVSSNSPLLSFTNGEHLTYDLMAGKNKTEKIKVKVTFSGLIKVDAERDSKKVNISHQFGGVAALSINESEDDESLFKEPTELDDNDINQILDPIRHKYEDDQMNLEESEIGVVVGHGAKTDLKVRAGKRKAEAKVKGGFVVGVKTKITNNF